MAKIDLTQFGGKPILPMGARLISEVDPKDLGHNFGVKHVPPALVKFRDTPSLHQKYPKMAGAWDGKSTVNHCDAVLKNYSGDWKKLEELIQYQPRGTCGGRAGSLAGDFIQHILIASGKKAKFHRVSHAAVYYLARKLYGMLNSARWQDDNDDGVASGSVPDALKKYGEVQREEADDANYYGQGSDDVACKLVCGNLPELAKKIEEAGSDNLLTDWARVSSAQELADGIASGGIGLGSDGQGFTMGRDKYGRCSPSGTWQHYQTRVSIGKYDPGAMFGYWQSWGKTTPSGPLLPGHPGNCFGVDFNVQDRIIKNGEWCVVFGFPLWELDNTPVVPWVF